MTLSRCPNCGDVVLAIQARAPTDHRADPCGCRIGALTVAELRGADPVRPDGCAMHWGARE